MKKSVRRTRIPPFWVVIWMAVACGGSEKPTGSAGSATDPVIRTAPPPPDEEAHLVVQELWRVGWSDGDGEFGDIRDIEVLSNGDLCVLDGFDQTVSVFDTLGRFKMRFGQSGEGPGEFKGAAGLAYDIGGGVWVWDPRLGRIQLFGPELTPTKTIRRVLSGEVHPWPGVAMVGGGVIDVGLEESDGPNGIGKYTIVLQGRAQSRTATTLRAVHFEPDRIEWVSGGRSGRIRRPFTLGPRLVVDPLGFVWETYREPPVVVKRTTEGDTLMFVELPYRSVPIPESERDSVFRRVRRTAPGVSKAELPRTRPSIRRLGLSRSGQLFAIPNRGPDTGTEFDVLSMDGLELTRFKLPVRLEVSPPPVLVGKKLFGVVKGDFDIPLVVALSLPGSG